MKKKTTHKSAYARFMVLSPDQRKAEVAHFDQEFAAEKFDRPPSPATRRKLTGILKRARGRPKVGQGAKRVLVTVERSLLARADAEAHRRKITRAELVAEGLTKVLAKR